MQSMYFSLPANKKLFTLSITLSYRKIPFTENYKASDDLWLWGTSWVSRAHILMKKSRNTNVGYRNKFFTRELRIKIPYLLWVLDLTETLISQKSLYALEKLIMTRSFLLQVTETQFESAWLKRLT